MRLVVGMLVVTMWIGACGSEPNATLGPPSDFPESSPYTPSQPSAGPNDVDLSVERIMAALDQAEVDTTADSQLLLPPTLRSYMDDNGYEPAVVQKGDASIGTVCRILKEDAAQKVLIEVVDALLVRLKRNPTGDGFGLLVSAAGYGCAGYDTWLSGQIQLADRLTAPTAPPLDEAPVYRREQSIRITSEDKPVVDIWVDRVTCSDSAGLFPAKPGRIYVGVNVRYTAIGMREYDAGSWRVVVGDSSIGPGLNLNPDWSPTLQSGTLLPGQSVEGWMAFDAPEPTAPWALVHLRRDPEDGALFQLRFDPCP